MVAIRLRSILRWSAVALCIGVLGSSDVAHADDAKNRVERARKEADQREARARGFRREAAALLAELEAIDREVVQSRQSQRELRKRQQQVERELEEARAALGDAEKEVARIRGDLEVRLVALYKSRAVGSLPALYAAKDLQSGLRTFAGMQRVLDEDLALFARYQMLRNEWQTKEQLARSLLVEFEGNEAEYLKRKQQETKQLIERKNLVDLLRTRADRELRAAEGLREAAKRLEETLLRGSGATTVVRGKGLIQRRVPVPVAGKVRLGFGRQVDSEFSTVTQRMGIEIDAPLGDPVRAVGAGRVLFAGWFQGYGQMVIVDHGGGTMSVSGYLDQLSVKADDRVVEGQVLGTVGETGSLSGAGLYFELRKDGSPVNPQSWFER